MNQEQATQKASDLNAILSSANVTDQNYQAVETFLIFESTWEVILIPSKYNTQYGAATTPQLQAFGRVYIQTQTEAPQTGEYVGYFDINAANDSVLGPYLGL